jgi:hypothetical protein
LNAQHLGELIDENRHDVGRASGRTNDEHSARRKRGGKR